MADFLGRFLWYECMTPDVERAMSFYKAVAGWGTQVWTQSGESYTMWLVGERAIGGVMRMPPGLEAPSHWVSYIGTPDVDLTAGRAETLGAKICKPPTEIPTIGKFAVIADPQGATFIAFTPYPPANQPPAPPPPAPAVGDIAWNELATTDVAGALRFYGDLFGWTAGDAMDMGPAGIYQIFGLGATRLGGIYVKPKEMPGPPQWLYYIRVAGIEAAIALVKKHGGQVLMGPHDVPGGDRIAMCLDPMGAPFALVWVKALSQP
jgi:predicted enzyme related to lactoylglutathione lyase